MSERKSGKIWTPGIDNAFSGMTNKEMLAFESQHDDPSVKVMPDIWILKMGGQSVMDRGREAVYPIIEELLAAKKEGIKFILGVGGGTRARHAYAMGLDLGMPTGALAKIGGSIPIQNARMLQMLMANEGAIMAYDDDFEKLPLYLNTGCIPIMSGMPPFEFWEKSPQVGRIPQNRTDAGVYLLSEFFGAKGMIYIKDEDGVYTDDPKKNPDADLIEDPVASDLLASGQDDFIVERVVLEYMQNANHTREIRVVNGLKPGNVLSALRGEDVGARIRATKDD